MNEMTTVQTMTLDGGISCLDFVNSGYNRERSILTERLHTYQDLLILARRLDLFDAQEITRLNKYALDNSKEADQTLIVVRKVRALLYRLFEGLIFHSFDSIDKDALKQLNGFFAEALSYRVLIADSDQIKFIFDFDRAGLLAPVWKIVLDAHDLLNTGSLQYIRQCGRCAWIFLDKTKNHRKRWCSMESCGNSQKTKRYYQNKKQRVN